MNKISRCKVKTESVLPAFLAASGSGMVGVAGEALGGLYLRGRLGPAQGQPRLQLAGNELVLGLLGGTVPAGTGASC